MRVMLILVVMMIGLLYVFVSRILCVVRMYGVTIVLLWLCGYVV